MCIIIVVSLSAKGEYGKVILTQENIEQEHICCAMSDKKSAEGVEAKKEWLACRMEEGLKFDQTECPGKSFHRVFTG